MENNKEANLKEEYASYLMGEEEPLRSFDIGNTKILLTNERLIFLRKFPKSFTITATDFDGSAT